MSELTFRIQWKNGRHTLNNIKPSETIEELKTKISQVIKIPTNQFNLLTGFPPKPFSSSTGVRLNEVGLTNGDTLIIDEKDISQCSIGPEPLATFDDDFVPGAAGILLKQVVPSDNSCLFTSIGYVISGKIDTDCGTLMRKIIAEHVKADKESYNEAILGKPTQDYCDWINKTDSWGGAIEVAILSAYYGIEIAVVDITNAIINRFGEDKNYGMRAFLLFDGIHYDPLYLETELGTPPRTIFPTDDDNILEQAKQIASEAKSSRQYTDVNKFTLKCLQCDTLLVGQAEAQNHAKATSHTNFGEV